jgi:hypothetical protein
LIQIVGLTACQSRFIPGDMDVVMKKASEESVACGKRSMYE